MMCACPKAAAHKGGQARAKVTVLRKCKGCTYSPPARASYSSGQLSTTGLCLQALHTAFPYILTLGNGGNFGWEREGRVFAQCPGPDGRVDMRITGESVTVSALEGVCRAKHKVGGHFHVSQKGGFCLRAFDSVFPYLLLAMRSGGSARSYGVSCPHPGGAVFEISRAGRKRLGKGARRKKSAEPVCGTASPFAVSVASMSKRCGKYHPKQGEVFDALRLAPKGLCLHAYHVLYPYALALLYGADLSALGSGGRGSVVVRCPNGAATFEVCRSGKKGKKAIALLNRISKEIRPVDLPLYGISMRVVSVHGHCPQKHRAGEKFGLKEFNILGRKELCPAGFDAVFPLMFAPRGAKLRARCPDSGANVVYEAEQ
ncbi:MAG: hypothetical protein V1676_06735 [Candidatus Diapherotrites archaeon]